MKKSAYQAGSALLLVLLLACAEQPGADVVMELPLTTTSDEARQHFLLGQDAYDNNRFYEARDHARDAVEADSLFAMAHLLAAWTATSWDDYMASYRRALELAPNASEAERLLVEIEEKGMNNDADGQLELANRLVEVASESPRAWLTLASVQTYLNNPDEARASMERAVELSPAFAGAYMQLGNSYLFNEPTDYVRAEEHMQKVVELEPDEYYSYDVLGDVFRAMGDLEGARQEYTRAIDLASDKAGPLAQRGHVNSFLGDFEEARADFQSAQELGQANDRVAYARYRAWVNVYAGEPQAAIDELTDLIDAIDGMGVPEPRGTKVNVLSDIAMIAQHHGMPDLLEETLERRAELMVQMAEDTGEEALQRGQQANIVYWDGVLAARRGDYVAATAKANECMELMEADANPRKNELAHALLGLVSLQQGDYAAALEHFEQANPNSMYVKYHKALAHEGAGNSAEAAALFAELANYNFNSIDYALIRQDAIERSR